VRSAEGVRWGEGRLRGTVKRGDRGDRDRQRLVSQAVLSVEKTHGDFRRDRVKRKRERRGKREKLSSKNSDDFRISM